MKTVSGAALAGIAEERNSGKPSQSAGIPTPGFAHDLWSPSGLQGLIKTVSSAGVGLVFGLHVFGYVIWNSHLGRFGLRTNAFLSFDYIAAALCYGMFISAAAFPLWFVLYTVTERRSGIDHPMTERLWAIIIIWYAVMFAFTRLFFPDSTLSFSWWIDGLLLVLFFVHVGLIISLSRAAKAVRLQGVLRQRVFFACYLIVWSYTGFLREPNVDIAFVFSTCLIYVTATTLIGTSIEMERLKVHLERPGIQALVLVLFGCAALANASQFGRKQFALLPQTVGGGRPTTALLKSDFMTKGLGNDFALPTSGGCIGPILLLYESDTNVCFTTKENFLDPKKGAFSVKRDLVEVIATKSPKEDLLTPLLTVPTSTVHATPEPSPSSSQFPSVPNAAESQLPVITPSEPASPQPSPSP